MWGPALGWHIVPRYVLNEHFTHPGLDRKSVWIIQSSRPLKTLILEGSTVTFESPQTCTPQILSNPSKKLRRFLFP